MKYVVGCLWVLIFNIALEPQKAKASPEREARTSLQERLELNEESWDCKQKDRFEPCEINNRIIDDLNIRKSFYELWQASNPDLPLDQRSEQGGWIVSNGYNGYAVIPFPSSWPTHPCGIEVPDNFLDFIPSNLVGIVHTHPFFEGDDTTAFDVCGEDGSQSYESGGNNGDWDFLIQIANHLSDFCIKWYIIDGDHIFSMNPMRYMIFYPTSTFFQPANS